MFASTLECEIFTQAAFDFGREPILSQFPAQSFHGDLDSFLRLFCCDQNPSNVEICSLGSTVVVFSSTFSVFVELLRDYHAGKLKRLILFDAPSSCALSRAVIEK